LGFWVETGGYFEKLSYGSEILDMTSEGWMFGGDFVGTWAEKYSTCVDGGMSGPIAYLQAGSKNPHQHE
jgi:hypothetical protein